MHYLTNRYSQAAVDSAPAAEAIVAEDGSVTLTGMEDLKLKGEIPVIRNGDNMSQKTFEEIIEDLNARTLPVDCRSDIGRGTRFGCTITTLAQRLGWSAVAFDIAEGFSVLNGAVQAPLGAKDPLLRAGFCGPG